LTLFTERAGVPEHGFPVVEFHMLVEAHGRPTLLGETKGSRVLMLAVALIERRTVARSIEGPNARHMP